jgi:aquaporin Z
VRSIILVIRMDKNLRPYLAELIGTFALVVIGAGSVITSQLAYGTTQPQSALLGIALANGFILAAVLSATLTVSGGYLNPAVTLTLWVYKWMDGPKTACLIVAQLIGAVLAGLCLRGMFADDALLAGSFGTPHLNLAAFTPAGEQVPSTPSLQMLLGGIGIEIVLTFVLTFTIFGTTIDPRSPNLGGLGVGLALAALTLMGYPLTGAAANPARWLGPAVWEVTLQGNTGIVFRDHPIYWIGPIVGALLAGGVYVYLIRPAGAALSPTADAADKGSALSKGKK